MRKTCSIHGELRFELTLEFATGTQIPELWGTGATVKFADSDEVVAREIEDTFSSLKAKATEVILARLEHMR